MKKRRFISLALSLALAVCLLTACGNNSSSGNNNSAQSNPSNGSAASQQSVSTSVIWPTGSIQLLVPSKAGGVTDIYTRYVQKSLQTSTSANFATVNYDTEAVAYETLRSSKADGSTILFQHSTLICKYLTGAIDYDPATEFKVAGIVTDMGGQAIIVNPDAPYDTWDEFIAYAKEHPREIITGISTNGTTHFIFGQVQIQCGVELNFVECSAEADKLTNVAGGIINLANCSLSNAREYEAAGMVKVLGILGSGETEENYPEWEPITDVIWQSYLYCLAPANTDTDTLQAINASLKSLTEDAEYVDECAKMGGRAMWLSLEDSQSHFDETIATLSEVATALGINIRN